MKKLVFVMVAMFTMGIASCGNSTKSSEVVNDSDTVIVDTVVVDTLAADTVVAE